VGKAEVMPVTVSGTNPRVRVVTNDVQRTEPTTDVGTTTFNDDELKGILGLDDKFIQVWRSLFGGDSALQGYARGLSEGTTAKTQEQLHKELAEALETHYKLNKERYDAEHPGGLTGVMVQIGGAMYTIGGGAAKAALAIPDFLAMLARTSTWVRVGEGILGVACLVFGVVLLAKDLGLADTVLPIGKLASLVSKGKE